MSIRKTDNQHPYRRLTVGLSLLFLFSIFFTIIEAAEPLPMELREVGVNEKLGQSLPLDLMLQDTQGKSRPLSSFFSDKPVILSLVYFQCPMLCDLVSTGLKDAINDVTMDLGQDYRVLSLSFDPRDTAESASLFQERYRSLLTRPSGANDWIFLTADPKTIADITDSVGFSYYYDDKIKEFAHSSVLVVLMPDGRISRYIYGISYKPFDVKMALLEASDEKTVSTVERVLLFCYNYDPNSRGYVLVAWKLMRVGGIVTVLGLLIYVLRMRRLDLQKDREDHKG